MPRTLQPDGSFVVRCVNAHGSERMGVMAPSDMLTLLSAAKDDAPFVPIPEQGLPVRVYLCRACGYVEMYARVDL